MSSFTILWLNYIEQDLWHIKIVVPSDILILDNVKESCWQRRKKPWGAVLRLALLTTIIFFKSGEERLDGDYEKWPKISQQSEKQLGKVPFQGSPWDAI